jgi:putative ABC transport system permease protein
MAAVAALQRALAGLLFGVSATDPAALGVAVATLAVVSVLACYLPARRIARLNPAAVLKR